MFNEDLEVISNPIREVVEANPMNESIKGNDDASVSDQDDF